MSESPSERASGVRPEHSAARTLAVVLGAPLAAAGLATGMARFLPLPVPWSAAIGFHALVPLWVAFACSLALARSGARAWLFCGLACLPLLAAWIAGPP